MSWEDSDAEPWIAPEIWRAANPAIGVTVKPESIGQEAANLACDRIGGCLKGQGFVTCKCDRPKLDDLTDPEQIAAEIRAQWGRANPMHAEREHGPEPIEQEAARLVRGGARQKNYGHPRGDFDTIAAFWSPVLKVPVTAEQVALCMIGLKMARLASNPKHHDSLVDIIGYAICYDRLDEAA